MKPHIPQCRNCGNEYSTERWKLGYKWCKPCGEAIVNQTKRTVVPMNKSNYIMVTDRSILRQLNPKYQGAMT